MGLFPDDVIEKLKGYPWWRLSPVNLNDILFSDIYTALDQMSEIKSWDDNYF